MKNVANRMSSLKVILTSGRTIEQGITLPGIKISTEAKESTGVCFMDPDDMEKLKLIENQLVEIQTSEGEIVVKAKKSKDAPHPGIVFMPLGIYANWIIPPGSDGLGVPDFKGINATVKPTNKSILEVEELVRILLQKGGKKSNFKML